MIGKLVRAASISPLSIVSFILLSHPGSQPGPQTETERLVVIVLIQLKTLDTVADIARLQDEVIARGNVLTTSTATVNPGKLDLVHVTAFATEAATVSPAEVMTVLPQLLTTLAAAVSPADIALVKVMALEMVADMVRSELESLV